jgi:hypothetical protein
MAAVVAAYAHESCVPLPSSTTGVIVVPEDDYERVINGRSTAFDDMDDDDIPPLFDP